MFKYNCLNTPLPFTVSDKFKMFVKKTAQLWLKTNLSWLRFNGAVHLTFYEDIKTDLTRELTSIVDFLHLSRKFIKCALERPEGNFLRKKKKNAYSDKELAAIVDDVGWRLYKEAFARREGGVAHI